MLCCECADSETATAMVSYVCVRAENLLRMCYITSFSLVTSVRLFQFLNVPFLTTFSQKYPIYFLHVCILSFQFICWLLTWRTGGEGTSLRVLESKWFWPFLFVHKWYFLWSLVCFFSSRPVFVAFKNFIGSLRLSQVLGGRLKDVYTQLGVYFSNGTIWPQILQALQNNLYNIYSPKHVFDLQTCPSPILLSKVPEFFSYYISILFCFA